MADGGPSEQKALFRMAKGGRQEKFPLLMHIDRDRPHRERSVMKGSWKRLEEPIKSLLDALMHGERSFFKLIKTSQRYKKYFIASQMEAPEGTETFAKIMHSMSFAEQRYDSRSRPLMRFFKLLPIAIGTLVKLVENGTASEATHATELLSMLTGDAGFKRIVGAAVAADSMVLGWSFIRLSDTNAADYSISGPSAARQIHDMEALLKHGGLFFARGKWQLHPYSSGKLAQSGRLFRRQDDCSEMARFGFCQAR